MKARLKKLTDLLHRRMVIIDGAYGTAIAAYGAEIDLYGAYLKAGADVLKTNTFNTLPAAARESARAARLVAGEAAFVAGVIAPPHGVEDLAAATRTYAQMAEALLDGGADFLLLETIFDTRVARAAVDGISQSPAIFSATTDRTGRLPSGETMADFWQSVRGAELVAVGVNCAFGPASVAPALRQLAEIAEVPISAHPSAGLPGEVVDPAAFAAALRGYALENLVNLVGGCCQTTPAHIAELRRAVASLRRDA